jgi:hypothetical protein
MIKTKEVTWILIAIIIFEFIVLFPNNREISLGLLLVPVLVILTPIITKKIFSKHFNIKVEHKILEFQRFGWSKSSQYKKPFPIGLIFPIAVSFLSYGFLKPLTLLQFDVENIPERRLLKKRGMVRKMDINECDIAFTATLGFYSLLVLAIIGNILGYDSLTKYSIYYGFWNLFPVLNLDGLKIFFGSFLNWSILAIIFLIALVLVLL